MRTFTPACVPTGADNNCDGIDNNCNGAIDEGYVRSNTTCGIGTCARTGMTSCVNGMVLNSCMPGAPAANDTSCNGVDDNCNGSTDEGYVARATQCGTGACARTGTTSA